MKHGAILVGLTAVAVMTAGCASAEPFALSRPQISRDVGRGPKLAGQVQVVAYSRGNVRICTSSVMLTVLRYPPSPPACADGLPVVGVDIAALTSHATGKPERWGTLYLVGRYANGTFSVTSQRQWAPKTRGHDPFAKVPCPTPKGGWLLERSYPMMQALRHYPRLTGHHDIDSVAFFDNGSTLTVASTHPARTRAVLGRYGPRQLCVVHTRYPPKLVHAVRRRTVGLLRFASSSEWGWPTGGGGYSVSPAGEPTTSLEVLLVTPRLRAFLNRQPPGIIVVDAALHPIAASR